MGRHTQLIQFIATSFVAERLRDPARNSAKHNDKNTQPCICTPYGLDHLKHCDHKSRQVKGKKWTTGTKNLKKSAAYPEAFVEEYAELYNQAHLDQVRSGLSVLSKTQPQDPKTIWEPLLGDHMSAIIPIAGGVNDFHLRRERAKGSMRITDFLTPKVRHAGA